MTPERWKRLADLFESALEHEPAARAEFLAAACGDDPLLRSEIEGLLQSHEQAGTFGTAPAFHVAAVAVASSPAWSATARATLDLGSRLGRYEIVSLLGAGGMGEVYRARDPQLGREVGVKILAGRGAITSEQLRRFEREARAVGALNHSNILTVYDVGVERDIPYVVSELLEGETLRSRLDAGPLPVAEALDIALQIVSGLTAAHDKGVVHRDIKPENLFITGDGLVKILDFGLAKQTGGFPASHGAGGTSISEEGLLLGTAGYMSPEQVRGRQADARSDVFAFGAVLYEMLTGRRAFTGDSVVETMNAILTSDPPPPAETPELPAPLWPIVQQCLEKNLERRCVVGARGWSRSRCRPAFVDRDAADPRSACLP